VSLAGIITGLLYFIAVAIFLITKAETALTCWELLTVASAPVVMMVLLKLQQAVGSSSVYKHMATAFLASTCALTAVAHFVNIAVTRPLISQGVAVPTYFQIGYWPSVEMAIDYVAWGFFCGLAFLCVALGIKNSLHKRVKITSLICGLLCLLGFFGALFVHENCWYIAIWGYGIGFIVLCSILYVSKL
ncbi:MAG: hypothetical protein II215_06860, partial [Paludibacteraceae bacterium]|nr:hypothetical protein [Paludibacteraceae bacterium]